MNKSHDLYLLLQVLVYAIILLFINNVTQHIILLLIAYISFLLVEKTINVNKILKCLFYMMPAILGFALAAFIFSKNHTSVILQLHNALYLSIHFVSIILISFLYTSSINLTSLIIYGLKHRVLTFSLACALIMVDMIAKLILQDWHKIFIVYRMRTYHKFNIIKPLFLLLLNSISYAQELSISVFVRGIMLDQENAQSDMNFLYNNIGISLTSTTNVSCGQYALLILPIFVIFVK
jgi:hypothetical protein